MSKSLKVDADLKVVALGTITPLDLPLCALGCRYGTECKNALVMSKHMIPETVRGQPYYHACLLRRVLFATIGQHQWIFTGWLLGDRMIDVLWPPG